MTGLQIPCAHQGRLRCWPCMLNDCRRTPSLHEWWDVDDVAHAARTGQEPPSGHCGCAFCGEPAVKRAAPHASAAQPATPPTCEEMP